jgi:hypothetical protein
VVSRGPVVVWGMNEDDFEISAGRLCRFGVGVHDPVRRASKPQRGQVERRQARRKLDEIRLVGVAGTRGGEAWAGLGTPRRSRRGRHTVACQATSGGRASPSPTVSSPAAQASIMLGRWAIAIEQVGEVAEDAEAAEPLRLVAILAGAADVGGDCGHPAVVEMLVDDRHQRPHRPLGQPRIGVRGRPRWSPHRGADARGTETRCWPRRRCGGSTRCRTRSTAAGCANARCRGVETRRPPA